MNDCFRSEAVVLNRLVLDWPARQCSAGAILHLTRVQEKGGSMEWSADEIKRAIADNEISAITLDTSVFDGNGNRFEHGLLPRLAQFNTTEVSFVLSDVVAGEVRRHVTQEAAEARSKVMAVLKEVGKAWQVSTGQRDEALALLFGKELPEALAHRRFNAFVKAVGAGVIESGPRVDVARMLDDYFSSKPPFGKSALKKNEFPDAIALQALASWAEEHGTVLLAVSRDADWKKFAKTSEHLVVIDDLAEALGYFHQNANVACARLVERVANGKLDLIDTIRGVIESEVDRSIFIPVMESAYNFDADVYEAVVKTVALDTIAYLAGPFSVVDKPSETELVVEAEVEVEIDVVADITFSVTDSVDRDEVPIGSARSKATINLTFNVLLTFEGDLAADAQLTDAEVWAKGKDRYITVDFGEVSPQWDIDEEEEEDDVAGEA